MRSIKQHLQLGIQLAATAVLIAGSSTQTVLALTQHDLYTEGINYFNIQKDADCDTTADTSTTGGATTDTAYITQPPAGADDEEKIYHFFVDQVHLSPAAAAGIMGNMQNESHFDPSIEQNPPGGAWEDYSSNNVNHGGKGGVGLVQWDGGRRPAYMNYAKDHKADKKTLLPQLNYVWYELNHGYKSTLDALKAAKTAADAAFQFHKLYEGSADGPAKVQNRMNNATKIQGKYEGKAPGTANASTGTATDCETAGSNSTSPECGAATGTARILCAAKKYDIISYRLDGTASTGHGGAKVWHEKYCKTISTDCYLDCSGLVNIAVYDIYRIELNESTVSERSDIGKHWEKTTFEKLQPGDLIQPHEGHVEIVDHVKGNTIYTFGAHTSHTAQPKQVGPSSYTNDSTRLYLHFKEK